MVVINHQPRYGSLRDQSPSFMIDYYDFKIFLRFMAHVILPSNLCETHMGQIKYLSMPYLDVNNHIGREK